MKVLWIIGNINDFPEAVKLLSGESIEIKSTGGWLSASANMLVADGRNQLAIAAVSAKVNKISELKGKDILYYILPVKGSGFWKKLVSDYNPEVIHIHGTENSFQIIRFLNECGSQRVVVSMQGVINAISKYSHSGINTKDKLFNITIHDIIRHDYLFSNKKTQNKSIIEREIISRIQHVIGRTICDYSYTWAINPSIKYHICNETLREEFYTGKWIYDNCHPHTIFLSQASRPLKGLHILLQALPYVKRIYPDLKVRIAGDIFTKAEGIMDRLRLKGYGRYINKVINRLNLYDNVEFIGPLNAAGMKREYLIANLFVNPSTIENSPNSLCEAQILGVPCLSSYVGGVPDMIPNSSCGEMYRFDEIEVLACKICTMFATSPSFDNSVMRTVAHERHDPQNNLKELEAIYERIKENKDENK